MVHFIIAFSRNENLDFYLENIKDKNINFNFLIQEYVPEFTFPLLDNVFNYNIPIDSTIIFPNVYKYNIFVSQYEEYIIDDDWYGFLNDDDWIEDGIDTIDNIEGDVVFISMKRGYKIPNDDMCPHGTSTLIAKEENVGVGFIGIEQIFVKGHILKQLVFKEHLNFDGLLAMELKEKYKIIYKPDLHILFNYLQKGRWDLDE